MFCWKNLAPRLHDEGKPNTSSRLLTNIRATVLLLLISDSCYYWYKHSLLTTADEPEALNARMTDDSNAAGLRVDQAW